MEMESARKLVNATYTQSFGYNQTIIGVNETLLNGATQSSCCLYREYVSHFLSEKNTDMEFPPIPLFIRKL